MLWDKERLHEVIRKRYITGKSLKYVDVKKEQSSLPNIAYRYYDSWSEAIAGAGVFYEVKKKPRGYWTKEKVLKELYRRKKEGKGLRSYDVKRDDSGLCGAVYRIWGSWGKMLDEIGHE